jgi:hypothetical protein
MRTLMPVRSSGGRGICRARGDTDDLLECHFFTEPVRWNSLRVKEAVQPATRLSMKL